MTTRSRSAQHHHENIGHYSCTLFLSLWLDAHRHDLSLGDDAPNIVNAVIEIPRWVAPASLLRSKLQPSVAHQMSYEVTPLCRGSKVKYELDKDTGMRER